MTQSLVTTTHQTITIGDVENISVTPVVLDETTGLQVREIRISGAPNGTQGAPVFVLRLSAADADKIRVLAPEQVF